MEQESKEIYVFMMLLAVIIVAAAVIIGSGSPCQRPFPNAQTIIECMRLQPTNTPK